MRRAIERDAASNHTRVAAEAFLPEVLRHQRDIGSFLFFREKIATENRANTQHVKIVRRQSSAKYLNRIAESGQSKGREILRSEAVENCLTITVMLIARHRYGGVHQIARFVATVETNHPRRLLERETA